MRIVYAFVLLGFLSPAFPAVSALGVEPSVVVASIRDNMSLFSDFKCRYRYTVGVIPLARDGLDGPYYRESLDGSGVGELAQPCSEIRWLRKGTVQLLENRLVDPGIVAAIRKQKVLKTCADDSCELFSAYFGIRISHSLMGGGLWEGDQHVRSIQTPFDYFDAHGSNGSLSLTNLLARASAGSGVRMARSEELVRDGVRVAEFEFVGMNGDQSRIAYTVSLDEGCLPVSIEIGRPEEETIQRYYIKERRQVDGAGWIPARIVKATGSPKGDGPAEVRLLELTEFSVGVTDDEFRVVLPKMYALHLGELWNSQFINDVERPVDLAEVARLVTVAKRIAAGEPRGNFLVNPIAISNGGQAKVAPKKSWLILVLVVNLACGIFLLVWMFRRRVSPDASK